MKTLRAFFLQLTLYAFLVASAPPAHAAFPSTAADPAAWPISQQAIQQIAQDRFDLAYSLLARPLTDPAIALEQRIECLRMLAEIDLLFSYHDKALAKIDEALSLTGRNPQHSLAAQKALLYGVLCQIYFDRYEMAHYEEAAQAASELALSSGSQAAIGDIALILGRLKLLEEDEAAAQNHLQAAQTAYAKTPVAPAHIEDYRLLCELYSQVQRARQTPANSAESARQSVGEPLLARAWGSLLKSEVLYQQGSLSYHVLNDAPMAKNRLEEALRLRRLLKSPKGLRANLCAPIAQLLSEVYYSQGSYKEAYDVLYADQVRYTSSEQTEYENAYQFYSAKAQERLLLERIDLLKLENSYQSERLRAQSVILSLSVVIAVLLLVLSAYVYYDKKRISRLTEQVYQESIRDSLTGVYNRRQIMRLIEQHLQDGTCKSLLLLDIDNFKRINDTLGHQKGDETLRQVALLVQDFFLDQADIGRYGGEEFLLCLHEVEAAGAYQIAEQLRRAIAAHPWDLGDLSLTVSIGLTTDLGSNTEALFSQIDQRLYEAKHRGKNQVIWDTGF